MPTPGTETVKIKGHPVGGLSDKPPAHLTLLGGTQLGSVEFAMHASSNRGRFNVAQNAMHSCLRCPGKDNDEALISHLDAAAFAAVAQARKIRDLVTRKEFIHEPVDSYTTTEEVTVLVC